MNRYKVTLSSNTVYKEIELTSDMQQVKVGTGVDCDVRLRKELFFGQIELVFAKNGDSWAVSCSEQAVAVSLCFMFSRNIRMQCGGR